MSIQKHSTLFLDEVTSRLGVLPNLFAVSGDDPGFIGELWRFATSCYLDNPLPSLFKERLCVYLSRFCVVRYCVVRHAGFLIGQGRPAGDANVLPQTIEDVIALLGRPFPGTDALFEVLAHLESCKNPAAIPEAGTPEELDLFDTLAVVFLQTNFADRARRAVRSAYGETNFELLTTLLTYIRTAHYWTENHPGLTPEPDMQAVMAQHPHLAALLLNQSEATAVLFSDIIRRKHKERRQGFLLELSDTLRTEIGSEAVGNRAARMIADRLGADRVYLITFNSDDDNIMVTHEARREDMPPLGGSYRGSDFPSAIKEIFERTIVYSDVRNDARLTDLDRLSFAGLGAVGFMAVPIRRGNEAMIWAAGALTTQPRTWSPAEIALFEDAVERTWAAVEKARAEDALRQSEERLKTVLQGMDEAFYALDPDWRFLFASRSALKMWGRDAEDILGKSFLECFPQAAGSADYEAHQRVMETGVPGHLETVSPVLGRWVEIDIAATQEGGLSVAFRDIDDRRTREINADFLEDIDKELALLSDPEAIMEIAGKRIGEFLRLSGCVFAEVNEEEDEITVHQGWMADGVPSLKRTVRFDEYVNDDLRRSGHSGELFVVRDTRNDHRVNAENYARLRVGAIVAVHFHRHGRWTNYLAVTDTSARNWTAEELKLLSELASRIFLRHERARAQAALQKSEEQFRLLGVASSDSIYRMNPDWTQMEQLIGKTFLADMNEPDSSWLQTYIPAEEQQQVRRMIQKAIQSKSILELEHRILRADGTKGWAFSRSVPVLDELGGIREWLGAASDITARKEAEEVLVEAGRRKDEFLAMLAHELRNPVSTIRNGLSVLKITHHADQQVSEIAGMMDSQAAHLVRMIDDLLDVSRVTLGKIQLKLERIELGSLVANTVQSVRPQFETRKKKLFLIGVAPHLFVQGDATRIAQIVTNLLTNGLRYTGDDGQVWVSVAAEKTHAVVTVKDNGIGLSPDEQKSIFDLFVQADNSLARAQGGLGIGLTLVKRLAEMHGGRVEVQSPGIGQGSEFRVYLPLDLKEQQSLRNKGNNQAETSALQILLIDDMEDLAKLTAMLLKLKGFHADIRLGGKEGAEAVEILKPSMVICDIGMPDLDGYQTAQLIRQGAWGRTVKMIALSGYGQEEDKQRAKQAGFDAHITKPVDINELQLLIAKLMNSGGGTAGYAPPGI